MKLLIIIRYCINRKFFLNKIINHYLLYKLNIYYYQRNLSFNILKYSKQIQEYYILYKF